MFLFGPGPKRFDTRPVGPYHARAMGDPLRDRCLPRVLAENKQVIEISDEIGDFTRLAELVEGNLSALNSGKMPAGWRDRAVTGTMSFGFADAAKDAVALDLSVTTAVAAVCQRCLKPFEMPVATALQLLLGAPDETLEGRDGYEIWELSDDEVSPLEIVEEALIMALPFSAMHENTSNCVELDTTQVDAKSVDEEMTRPFASLRAQMDDG
jgi:uncharacterized metal-binding protein YceD (DUF177 family)